jgi:hypothetical protein
MKNHLTCQCLVLASFYFRNNSNLRCQGHRRAEPKRWGPLRDHFRKRGPEVGHLARVQPLSLSAEKQKANVKTIYLECNDHECFE